MLTQEQKPKKRMPLMVLNQHLLVMARSMTGADCEPRDPFWPRRLQELLEKAEIDLPTFARLSETAFLCCGFSYEDGKLKVTVCNLTKRATAFTLFTLVKVTIEEQNKR